MKYRFREIWKTAVVDGVENPRYQVSNLGRIKCLNWKRTGKPRLCRLTKMRDGYLGVGIDRVPKYVHRLVAETFIPNPQHKKEVDHVDTNRQNDCVWNLKWATMEENRNNPLSLKHYSENNPKHWLGKFGAEHNRSIAIVQLTLGRQFVKKWSCAREAERELGIASNNITACCKGKRKSAGGYRWMYYDDWLKLQKPKRSLFDIQPLF